MANQPFTSVIPFGPLSPDAGEERNPGLLTAYHVIPQAEGYTFPSLTSELSDSIGSSLTIKGAMSGAMGEYLYQIYVGDATKLYEVNSLDATPPWGVDDVSQAATTYVVGDSGWHFCQYGTHLVACPGADYGSTTSKIQWLSDTNLTGAAAPTNNSHYGDAFNLDPTKMWQDKTGEGSFPANDATYPKQFRDMIDAAASTYEYKARFCAAADYRIIIAHLYDTGAGTGSSTAEYLPNRVAWSKTDDPTEFHDATVNEGVALSDYQDLLDDWGPITGMSGGSDYTLIFKARGIYRMTPGGPFQYSFQPVPNALGTRWSHSIVRIGNDVYFWGVNGPSVYLGAEHRVVEIGLGKISRSIRDSTWITNGLTVFDPDNTDEWLVKGVVDPTNGLILWTYPTEASAAKPGGILVYNYQLSAFSEINHVADVLSPEQTYPTAYILSIPDSAKDYSVPRDLVCISEAESTGDFTVRGWDPTESGLAAQPSVFLTSYVALIAGTRTMVSRVRPVFTLNNGETTYPVLTVSVNSRETPWGTDVTTTNTSANIDAMGWISLRNCPAREFHQFSFSFATTNRENVAEVEGFEVEYSTLGIR